MATRTYTSTVTAFWTVQRQEELLRAALPGWPVECVPFHDEVDPRYRRQKNPAVLVRRNELLRTTTRPGKSEMIVVPALAVFAMSIDDMLHALTLAGARGATVRFLHEGLTVTPISGAATLHEITKVFVQARFETRASSAGRISGDKKHAAALEKFKAVKAYYGDPNWTMARLEQASGLSRNTIIGCAGGMTLLEARRAWDGREAADRANAKRAAKLTAAKAKRKERLA
jgi:hypothetical protein